jgi:hypothetical protein
MKTSRDPNLILQDLHLIARSVRLKSRSVALVLHRLQLPEKLLHLLVGIRGISSTTTLGRQPLKLLLGFDSVCILQVETLCSTSVGVRS